MIKYKRITRFFYDKELIKKAFRLAARHRFIYRTDIIAPYKRPVFLKKKFVTLRTTRLFYLTLTYKQFWRMAVNAKRKEGLFEKHFCLALEGRLISFLYRTSFVSNMFESIQLVKQSFITINRKTFNYVNESVNLFDILSFHPIIKSFVYLDIHERLYTGRKTIRYLFNPPKYIFVSYWFLFAYMFMYPRRRKLVFPISVDIYRATGYAH